MRIRILSVVLLAFAVAPASAHAAKPNLSLDRADRAATRLVQVAAAEYESWRPSAEDPNVEVLAVVDSYDLDACERISRSRAECDVTFNLSTGATCDETFEIWNTRKNRLGTSFTNWWFDSCSDDPDTLSDL